VVASQRGKFDMGWLRKNGWYIVIGLIVLYWVLKLFILG
jgi:hypothetical protein